jgi:hypothetical protein
MEQDEAADYFMRSAAHEAIASGDLTLACVGASRSAPVMDALLATFVAGRGIWVTRDQRSVDLHICPVAGITAAYLRFHHVYVPREPAITLGPTPAVRAPRLPLACSTRPPASAPACSTSRHGRLPRATSTGTRLFFAPASCCASPVPSGGASAFGPAWAYAGGAISRDKCSQEGIHNGRRA